MSFTGAVVATDVSRDKATQLKCRGFVVPPSDGFLAKDSRLKPVLRT